MQKKSLVQKLNGAQKFFVVPVAVLVATVYAASAAPKKPDISLIQLAEKKAPSLFAPTIPSHTSRDVQRESKPGTPVAGSSASSTVASPRVGGVDSNVNWTMTLDVDRQQAEDWEDAYYRYFEEHQVHPRVLRDRVRALTDSKTPDLKQVIGMLRASLRAGQIQPWMYEALALAMRIEKKPAVEIERVLLSSADFATSARQIIFLAEYMDRLGYRKRGLELLREVTLRDPSADLAYAKAFEIATYLNDTDALRWSTLGVLSQEWPRENANIFESAVRSSKALIKQMRENGLNHQADQYASKVRDALSRDVVVKVSWSGDADVDLMVEEPSGSVCSYRQNKTPGGGLLVGDPIAKSSDEASGVHSEVYSCPEAFSGDYRVLVRQVWGRIPAGRVKVDVWSHLGTDKQQHVQKVIPLDDAGALVSFHLDAGRRQEQLSDQQLANDVVQQVAVNRTILAQQLEAITNPEVILAQQNYANSQPASQIGNRTNPLNRPAPNAFNPNVGYQPQITVLPVGITMQANAVISADRRYVRITTIPFFSAIRGVVQYNLQTGVTSQGQSDAAFANLDLQLNGAVPGGGQPNPGAGGDGGGGGGGGGETPTETMTLGLTQEPVAGFVSRAAVARTAPDLSQPLVVTLRSGDRNVLQLPGGNAPDFDTQQVTIPPGRSFVTFLIAPIVSAPPNGVLTGEAVTASGTALDATLLVPAN